MRYPMEFNRILNGGRYNTFGWVRENGNRFHQGWDLVNPIGTEVFPVAEGKIVYAQPVDKPKSRYGIALNLKFKHKGRTYYAFYAHLQDLYVTKGETITDTNKAIGTVGDSGNAKGIKASSTHLHFEFRNRRWAGKGENGRVDPVEFYGSPPYGGITYYAFEDEVITA